MVKENQEGFIVVRDKIKRVHSDQGQTKKDLLW